MQLASPQDSITQKISSSIKKSHKISIYSKKSTKSPKKYQHQQQQVSRVQETKDFHSVLMMASDKLTQVSTVNGLKFNQNYSMSNNNSSQMNGTSHRNNMMNVIDLSKTSNNSSNRGMVTRQQSYQQPPRQQNSFFDTTNNITPTMVKKPQTMNENTFTTGTQQVQHYHHTNGNSRNMYNNSNAKNNYPTSYPSHPSLKQHSVHNISQMIDKEAESQTNNLSVLQGSFLTGVKNTSFNHNIITNNPLNLTKNKDSQNSQQSSSQQQQMQSFMKFMHQQIFIAKQKCEKRVNQVLKDNAKVIGQLKEKLVKNEMLLREKTRVIERMMREGSKKGIGVSGINGKKAQSEGEIEIRKQLSAQQAHKTNNNQNVNNSYYQKRISDLQTKLSIVQLVITQKSQHKQHLQAKLQILQKHLITYNYTKLKHLSIKLQSFISNTSQKLLSVTQQYQKLRISFDKNKQQQYGFNQNLVKEQKQKVGLLQKELEEFMGKEFIYENFNVQELRGQINGLKEQVRRFEGVQFENSKLVKQLMSNNNNSNNQHLHSQKPFQNNNNKTALQTALNNPHPPSKLITLSNINQTTSKYTLTNPNMSKVSISQLSNTHEYSHLIEKVSPNEKYQYYQRASNNYYEKHDMSNNSESLISMNFTQEASQSMTPRMKGCESIKYHQKQNQNNAALSKLTKNTDLKQTCSQLQATPPSASKYYLPTTKTSISIHSIIAPNQSSTQQKIRNLNDLKMQTLPLLHSNKLTPQKYLNQHQNTNNNNKKSIYYQNLSQLQQSLDQNNASYLSIGQMEDFNLSRRDINNETSDFSDDEFFYPGYRQDNLCEWQSPEKSYKTTERFLETQEFSPMKKKLTSTEQHFYQSTKSPEVSSNMQQSRDRPGFMYNSNLDYEKFSDDEEEDRREVTNEVRKIEKNFINQRIVNNVQTKPSNTTCKLPLPSPVTHQKHQPTNNLTPNQQKLITSLKTLKKHQLPVKLIYDRKKSQGIMRMLDTSHILNGKTWQLDKKQVERLQGLGWVQVKTYV